MDGIFLASKRLEPACLVFRLGHGHTPDLVSAVARLVGFRKRDGYVVRHETTLHEHPCLISNYMKYADERPW